MGQMADSSNSITQPTEPREEDLDASIEADINQDPATQPDGKTLEPNSADDIDGVPEVAEPRILTKKDATLREFLNKMDDHAPIVSRPDPLCPLALSGRADMSMPLDTGCGDKLLYDARWPASSAPNLPAPEPSPRSRNAEVHC